MSRRTASGLDRRELTRVADQNERARRRRIASSSRAISDSDTIDVSSTITTSWGRRVGAVVAERGCGCPAA